jgi:succinate dehydrogenase/fumarate reductase flavoprotein subunit
MSINRLQRPRLVVVGNGMAGMRTVEELHWLGGIHDQRRLADNVNRYKAGHTGVPRKG